MALRSLIVGLALMFSAVEAMAGAAPSQWVVVVNGNSARSRTIANHYCYWRDIPMLNVITLNDVPAQNTISMADFRQRILTPLVNEIERRKLTTHIQGVAYSADFPTAIDLSEEPKPQGNQAEYLTRVASINSMTYFHNFVRSEGTNYIAFQNNWYAQRPGKVLFGSLNNDPNSEIEVKLRTLREAKDYYKLGEFLDSLFRNNDHQYPVAYMSAQAWAQAGQSAKALQKLQQAMEAGWCFSKYTQDDEALKSLHEYSRFQALVRSCDDHSFDWTPMHGFDSRRYYCPNAVASRSPKSGVAYLLSFTLALCMPLGNTQEEVLAQLKRSVDADFTRPEGVFYFTKTDDIRTKCREAGFDLACQQLKKSGFESSIISEPVPQSKTCLGVTIGVPSFNWKDSKSTLAPGALGDNLTSQGGEMEAASQTKLTEFLRYGAAAASGTVTEPYSVQAKFPHPTMQASYAAGLTAAEAYYAAITGPYQLLIAGDPMCQPFAKPPRFKIRGIESGAQIDENTKLEIVPSDELNSVKPIQLSMLLDGEFKGNLGFPIRMNIHGQQLSTGAHEFRFIALDDTRIETRWEKSFWVTVGPDYNQVKLSGPPKWKASEKKPLIVEVFGSDSDAVIELRYNKDYLVTVQDGKTKCEVPVEKLGTGPVRLQAVAVVGTTEVASLPITVVIEE